MSKIESLVEEVKQEMLEDKKTAMKSKLKERLREIEMAKKTLTKLEVQLNKLLDTDIDEIDELDE